MTVREMHIEVEQSVQQVAANRSRKLFSEELDWILTKMQERYIQSRLRPSIDRTGRANGGFVLDQIGADSIRPLIKRQLLVPYILTATQYRCALPPDYMYLVSDTSDTCNLCGTAAVEVTDTMYITRMRHDRTAKSGGPFYETSTVQFLTGTVVIPADLPYGRSYIGYPSREDISMLAPFIALKGGWYWERYDDLYFPGSYVFARTTAGGTTTLINDGTAVVSPTVGTVQRSLRRHTALSTSTVPNRLCASETIPPLRHSTYQKPLHSSPISELAGQSLYIYRTTSFTVISCEVTYIRKPQPISLSLGTDCELAPEFHQTICDLATAYIKNRLENDKGAALVNADLAERVII